VELLRWILRCSLLEARVRMLAQDDGKGRTALI
jgi:hypothetical protein